MSCPKCGGPVKSVLVDFQHKLRHTESERLQIQVNAYLDNMIDVRLLLEDSDTKSAALDKMADMELELSYVRRL